MTKTFLQQAEAWINTVSRVSYAGQFQSWVSAVISFAKELDAQKSSEHQTVTISLICSTHVTPGPWCTKDCRVKDAAQKEQEKPQGYKMEKVVLHASDLDTLISLKNAVNALIEDHNNSL